ncbi:hypothetical protein LA345_36735 (plasmid) [Burkholderia vietnamiensis]|uniref:Uncharacterized protein n=1 Tax=Burkholderia vietnamiensis (strain G4 / LMG 22486) TaxID=269482 RepID=A4JVW8_BURVG|nr:hypothetical protein Bcep1808_7546 [Burkholderia vietnamiensis G4]MCB4349360.1 hypothetical protein [Burkholderia vietnamiensis]
MSPISNALIASVDASVKQQTLVALAPLLTYLVGYFVRRFSKTGTAQKFNVAAAFALLFVGASPVAFGLASMLRLAVQMQTVQTVWETGSLLHDYAIVCKYDPSKRRTGELEAAEKHLRQKDVLWKMANVSNPGRPLSATEPIPCDVTAVPDLREIQASMPLLVRRSEYVTICAYTSSMLALVFVWLMIHPIQLRKRVRDGREGDAARVAPNSIDVEPSTAGSDAVSSGAKW